MWPASLSSWGQSVCICVQHNEMQASKWYVESLLLVFKDEAASPCQGEWSAVQLPLDQDA